MTEQIAEDAALTTARTVGYVQPHTVDSDEFELIRSSFFDDRASIEPKDIYGYRLIACSDGADAYYTRQDPDTSMVNYVDDLKAGMAVLTGHKYDDLPTGNSYHGRLVEADAGMRQYEPTFYREMDQPEYRATKWVVGDYYIPRGITLNQQSTDDLIRAIETGVARRASITFTIGKHVCSIDGKDMLLGWDRMLTDPDELECRHFPGIKYEGAWCTAWMKGNQLLETSHVYRNASPSSSLIQKASVMASRGMLPAAELVKLEERIGQRLPRPDQRLFVPGGAVMSKRETEAPAPEPTPPSEPAPEPTPPSEPEAPAAEPTDQPTEQPTEEGAEPINIVETASTVAEMVAAELAAKRDSFTTAQLEALASAEHTLEAALQAAGFEGTAGGRIAQQYETRNRAIAEALGTDLTVEAVRNLKRDADMGGELYAELVRDAVAARVGALGEHANADEYRRQLETSRNVGYVKAEIAAFSALKAAKFTPGRTVIPVSTSAREAAKPVDAAATPNILTRS